MLHVEGGGKSLLYTGDFRGHGRKSFPSLLRQLPERVDFLVCEGTNLSRKGQEVWSEKELEDRAAALMKQCRGPAFVLQAATNLDRLVTFYRAAKRSSRIFLEDLYQAEVAAAAGPSIPQPGRFQGCAGISAIQCVSAESARYQRLCCLWKRQDQPRPHPGGQRGLHPALHVEVDGKAGAAPPPGRQRTVLFPVGAAIGERPEMSEFLSWCGGNGDQRGDAPQQRSRRAGRDPAAAGSGSSKGNHCRSHPVCPDWFEKEGTT